MKENWNIHNTENPPRSTVLTVSALTSALKNLIESRFTQITVQGEISNFKPNSSGHFYFDLKDSGAKISAVMFRSHVKEMARLPKEGDQVVVMGALSLYPPHGKYQIVVQSLQFAGLGEMLVKLEELKKKLQAKGWFDKEKKKPLPKFPKKIGVITSPTGAVIRDIVNVLSRRYKGFHLLLNPVKVQGEGAAFEIASAIADFNRYQLADVLIVGRGGGSLEDLWAFNEEKVAEAIFKSTIPIISAVGHETDFTIADFVADCRAPTPSAAAEIVISEKSAHLQFLEKTKKGLQHTLSHLLKQQREKLKRFTSHPFFSIPYAMTGPYLQRLDDIKRTLAQSTQNRFNEERLKLESRKKELQALNPLSKLAEHRQSLKRFATHPLLSTPDALTKSYKARLLEMKKEILFSTRAHAAQKKLKLEGMKKELAALTPLPKVHFFKERIRTLQNRLDTAVTTQNMLKKEKLKQIVQTLISLDPKQVLKRGYSILFARKGGSVIVSAQELSPGLEISAKLADGERNLRVEPWKN